MADDVKLAKDDLEQRPWHALSTEDAAAVLDVDPERGLDEDEARRRRERFGENRLQEQKGRSSFRRLINQFNNLFIYLLLIAGVVTAALGEYVDSAVIFAVVLIIAVIGFVQEGRAERALESVQKILSHEAWVTREGKRRKIPAEELVPGDIVHLNAGAIG